MPIQPPPAANRIDLITSRLVEAVGLGIFDYKPVAIPMYDNLSTSRPRGGATYILPPDHKFRLQSVRPHIVPIDVFAEDPGSGFGGYTGNGVAVMARGVIFDHLYGKAHNCRFTLQVVNNVITMNQNPAYPLSSLCDFVGGEQRFLDCPMDIPSGTAINLSLALQDTSSTACGGETEYGVVLVGALIRE